MELFLIWVSATIIFFPILYKTDFLDSLIRTHYYKYFHPKECYISDSKINANLNKDNTNINLIYPFGCTLNVLKPGVVAFTSGTTTFPVDRPLGALYYNENSG